MGLNASLGVDGWTVELNPDVGGVAMATNGGGIYGPDGFPINGLSSPAKYKKWRAAVAAVRNGTANARILCVGDSTTVGAGAGGSVGFTAGAAPKNMVNKLAVALNRNYLPAQSHGTMGTGNIGTVSLLAFDTRFTIGAGWTAATVLNENLGMTLWNNSTNTATLTFTPTAAVDTYVIHYARASSTGTFNAAFGAGAPTAVSTSNATPLIASVTITGALGVTPINISRASGSNMILGIRAYNSAEACIEVIQAGASGAVAANLDGSTNPWDAAAFIQNGVQPHLTIYCIGINDWVNATSISAFETSVRTTITACKVTGDVIIVTPAPSAASAAPLATQRAYVNKLMEIAGSLDCEVVNLWGRFGTQEDAILNGFYVDTLHPSGLGYSDWAQVLANKIMYL